ncbi:symbiosis-related like protein, partial [Parasitella parasitica]
ESKRVLAKYPGRIPIICEKVLGNSIPNIAKQKYLIPSDLCLGQFIYAIRKGIRLSEEKAIYMYIDGNLPTVADLYLSCNSLANLYGKFKDEDGFLYMNYAGENTFGCISQ